MERDKRVGGARWGVIGFLFDMRKETGQGVRQAGIEVHLPRRMAGAPLAFNAPFGYRYRFTWLGARNLREGCTLTPDIGRNIRNWSQPRDTRIKASFTIAFSRIFPLSDALSGLVEHGDGLFYRIFVGHECSRLRRLVSFANW